MVEFKCLGHDSRHVCRSVLVAPGVFYCGNFGTVVCHEAGKPSCDKISSILMVHNCLLK